MHWRGVLSQSNLYRAALGQIPSTQTQTAPQTPNVQAATLQPAQPVTPDGPRPCFSSIPSRTHPSLPVMLTTRRRKTATMQFKNGQVHQYYGVTPDDWANYKNFTDEYGKPSPGKGFNQFIKSDPSTGAGRTSRPLTATSAKSAVQEAPPASANEFLERYIGLF